MHVYKQLDRLVNISYTYIYIQLHLLRVLALRWFPSLDPIIERWIEYRIWRFSEIVVPTSHYPFLFSICHEKP